jgi:hypothetical protein
MAIKQGEEVQAKSIHNTFNKIIAENFPNIESYPFRYSKPPGHQTGLTKIEPLHGILSLKQLAERTEKKY